MTKDILLANGPVMADYGNARNVAIIEIPVEYCTKYFKHIAHRYEDKRDIRKWQPEEIWKYCPGKS